MGETKPAPPPKTSAELALLHQSPVLTQSVMEGKEFALAHGLSMVPFLPMIPKSALPSLSLQLVPHIRFVPTLQGGPQAVGGIICQIQESPPWS